MKTCIKHDKLAILDHQTCYSNVCCSDVLLVHGREVKCQSFGVGGSTEGMQKTVKKFTFLKRKYLNYFMHSFNVPFVVNKYGLQAWFFA